jgi:hypothetical protein
MAFGVKHIVKETPKWATWMFRIVLALTTAASIWISGTSIIEDSIKVEIINGLKVFDCLALVFSKMFGVDVNVTTDNEGNEQTTDETPAN